MRRGYESSQHSTPDLSLLGLPACLFFVSYRTKAIALVYSKPITGLFIIWGVIVHFLSSFFSFSCPRIPEDFIGELYFGLCVAGSFVQDDELFVLVQAYTEAGN